MALFGPIPLPKMIPDREPGGPIASTYNKLTNEALAQEMQRLKNQYYGPDMESQIGSRNALTQGQNIKNQFMPDQLRLANESAQQKLQYNQQMNPLNIRKQQILLENLPESEKARIASQKAIANYKSMGGGGMGVGQKEEMMFQNLVARDNPQLNNDPNKIYEAANRLRQGETQLSDGTPLNPLSPASRESFNRLVKGGTTAPILTGNIKANQADAELKVLNDYAQKGLKPYGTTYSNFSPQQIIDSFKSDEKSQKQLGKFIASQALQYEAAQNRIRLANGQPGVAATEEIMKMSGQKIDTRFPTLSYTARNEAARYLDEALRKGLEARQSIGIGASESRGKIKRKSNKKPTLRYNQQTGDFEEIS